MQNFLTKFNYQEKVEGEQEKIMVTQEVMEEQQDNTLSNAEKILSQMQTTLSNIKETKQSQTEISGKIQELTILLAEKQAEEVKVTEQLLKLEIEWQDLTKKLNSFSDLNVSGD